MNLKQMYESVIGKVNKRINVILSLDKSQHAGERQSRHGADDIITDKEILSVADKSIDRITKLLIFDKLDMGDDIVIYDRNSNLNLISHLGNSGKGEVDLKIITVMRKKDFKPKSGTKKVII